MKAVMFKTVVLTALAIGAALITIFLVTNFDAPNPPPRPSYLP